MIKTCEQYAKEHNLTFSTSKNISKSKTKCMAFVTTERYLRPLVLCGHELPWVNSLRHLGNKIENKLDGMRHDMREKRAQFIQKNNEICQEFAFADSATKIKLNSIYNTHFTGSPIWDLVSNAAESIEKTWNVAMRKMLMLDRCTHKYFIEPLSEIQHIKWSLGKRFVKFTQKICESTKTPMKTLFYTIRGDCRSTTGRNMRHVMSLLNVASRDLLKPNEFKHLKYHEACDEEQKRRIDMVKELMNVKRGVSQLHHFDNTDIDHMVQYLCTT